jgi:hypothetical protein
MDFVLLNLKINSFKLLLKPFDLVLFSGGDEVSAFIKFVQYRSLKDNTDGLVPPGEYSHVGMIVTSDICEHPNILPNKFYVLESTMSGKYGQKLGNIDGFKNNIYGGFLGVQIRDFEELYPRYLKGGDTHIGYAKLRNNPIDDPNVDKPALKLKFTNDVYYAYNGITYDANCFSLLSSLVPCIRCIRDDVEKLLGTEDWLFCSELIALVYKVMGILPDSVNVKNVVPMDFIGYDNDGDIPLNIFELPPKKL